MITSWFSTRLQKQTAPSVQNQSTLDEDLEIVWSNPHCKLFKLDEDRVYFSTSFKTNSTDIKELFAFLNRFVQSREKPLKCMAHVSHDTSRYGLEQLRIIKNTIVNNRKRLALGVYHPSEFQRDVMNTMASHHNIGSLFKAYAEPKELSVWFLDEEAPHMFNRFL